MHTIGMNRLCGRKKYGVASMCIGGGQGLAVAVEII